MRSPEIQSEDVCHQCPSLKNEKLQISICFIPSFLLLLPEYVRDNTLNPFSQTHSISLPWKWAGMCRQDVKNKFGCAILYPSLSWENDKFKRQEVWHYLLWKSEFCSWGVVKKCMSAKWMEDTCLLLPFTVVVRAASQAYEVLGVRAWATKGTYMRVLSWMNDSTIPSSFKVTLDRCKLSMPEKG